MQRLLLTALACLISLNFFAQNIPEHPNKFDADGFKTGNWTILYDSEWNEIQNLDSVAFYRVISFEKGVPQGRVIDYYLNGNKQWEGCFLTEEIEHGACIWYNKNTSISTISNYDNGYLNGLSTYNDSIGNNVLGIEYSDGYFKELMFCNLNTQTFYEILKTLDNQSYEDAISISNEILSQGQLFFKKHPVFKSLLLNILSENHYYLAELSSAQKYQDSSYNIMNKQMKIEAGLYIDNLFGIHSLKSQTNDFSELNNERFNQKYYSLKAPKDIDQYLVIYNNISSNYIHIARYLNEYFGHENNIALKENLANRSVYILGVLDSIIMDSDVNDIIKASHLQRVAFYYALFNDDVHSLEYVNMAFNLIKNQYDSTDFSFIMSEYYVGKIYLYNYYYDDAAVYFTSVAQKIINNIDIYTSSLPNHLIDELYSVALEIFNSLISSDTWNANCYELYSLVDSREITKIKQRNSYLFYSNDITYQNLTDSLSNIYTDISRCYELSNKQQEKSELDIELLISESRRLEARINNYTIDLATPKYNIDDITSRLSKDEVFVDIIEINIDMYDSIPQTLPHYFIYVFVSDSLFKQSNYYNYYRDSDSLELNPVRGLDAWFIPLDYVSNLDSIYNLYNYYTKKRPSERSFNSKYQDYGATLYNALWYRVIDVLNDDDDDDYNLINEISKIYFSPEGIYSKINPNVLYDSMSKSFIIDKYDIVHVSGIEDFVKQKDEIQLYETPDNLNAVLIGNPTFLIDEKDVLLASSNNQSRAIYQSELDSLQRGMMISELPGTQNEIDFISDILKSNGWETELINCLDASETKVKNIDAPTVLHIATHGFFFEDQKMINRTKMLSTESNDAGVNPMTRSGLIFSGAENTMRGQVLANDNGWLNAYEASLLNLRGTELVVLSACETGTGEVQNGKGVYGLQRAIQVAGAETIIMSMWKVDDQATQELMTSFYDFWINKNMSKKEAFNAAQQKLREIYKHPYYWGAFIMIGE